MNVMRVDAVFAATGCKSKSKGSSAATAVRLIAFGAVGMIGDNEKARAGRV